MSEKKPQIIEKIITEKRRSADGINFENKFSLLAGKSDLVEGTYKLIILGMTLEQCEELSAKIEQTVLEFHGICIEANKKIYEEQKEKELLGEK